MNDPKQLLTVWLATYLVNRGLLPEQLKEVLQLKKTPSLEVGDVAFDARKAARLLGVDANLLAQEIASAMNL